MFRALSVIALLAALGAGSDAVQYPEPMLHSVQFANCRDFVNYLSTGQKVGEAHPQFLASVSGPQLSRLSDEQWQALATVTWSQNLSASTIELVDPYWANMSSAERLEMQRFTLLVEAHERGHFETDWALMLRQGGTLAATGATQDEAVRHLQERLERYQQDAQAALSANDIAYDNATDHGVVQSRGPELGFPGGTDVRYTCP